MFFHQCHIGRRIEVAACPCIPNLCELGRTSCFIISSGSGWRSDSYAGSPNQAAMVGQTCAAHAPVADARAILLCSSPSQLPRSQ